ncbi:MAG: homoserine kinase [Rhodospirillales bacterium]
MAVYTEIADEEVATFVTEYRLGRVLACKGIAEGIENTNYLLVTEAGTFILTLYERRVRGEDLPFFLGLMEHLAARGIPCPTPVHGLDGAALRWLKGRHAVIVTFLAGMWPRRPTPRHCAGLGEALARLHLAGADFPQHRANDLSVGAWRSLLGQSGKGCAHIADGLFEEIADELDLLESRWPKALPRGVIHADLFPDNVFFDGDRLSGLIDFYFACTDFFAYDLAICLNAWCFETDGSFNVTKSRRLVSAYQAVRPLTVAEMEALPLLARGAAVRFLLTRLYDWLHTPREALVTPKNPVEYLQKMRFHRGVRSLGEYGLDADRAA